VSWVLVPALILTLASQSRRYARVFATAETYWTWAIERNPEAWAARYNLALVLVGDGRFQEAIGQLEEAVRLRPDYAEAHTNLANALSQTGRYGEAVPHFERALQLDPANATTHYNFGLTLRALGRSGEGRAQLLEAARLLRQDPAR
jgi:tetratricopeptide (TPR) repeat protein